jgi:uncharacterized membrane protein (DUF485 family)
MLMEKTMNDRDQVLTKLAEERWQVSLKLTLAMMFIYFGFILLVPLRCPRHYCRVGINLHLRPLD